MRTLFTALLFILALCCDAQTVYKIQMNMERVPINHSSQVTRESREILIVTVNDYFGLYTGYDTLDLKRVKHSTLYDVYIDMGHDDQLYYMIRRQNSKGQFGIFIAPLKPYKRRLWGINLSNI